MTQDAASTLRAEVLERRARRLARAPSQVGERNLLTKVVLVAVEDQVLGLPSDLTLEVIDAPPITPLSDLPAAVVGIAQARGEILSVVDLARLLDIDGSGDKGCLAIVGEADRSVGLLADRAMGFADIYEDDLAEELERQDRTGTEGLIRGITTGLISVLDLTRLLASPRVVAGPHRGAKP